MNNIVAVIFIRLRHTGVYEDGRPNPASVTVYDLDEITIQQNRTRAVPVPPNSFVDIPMSSRTFLSYADPKGGIYNLVRRGLITAELHVQLRDKSNCGGPLGTGQALRPGVNNFERVGNVLRLVIPDIVLPDSVPPTDLSSVGFVTGEPVTITGFISPYRRLNGTWTITNAAPGEGLAGPQAGSYLIEFSVPGADIPTQVLGGLNLCLTNGRIAVAFNSNGNVLDQGNDFFGYIAGQLFPRFASGGGGTPGVNLLDENLALPNNPYTTINFLGAAVQAVDSGIPGQANVLVSGGTGDMSRVILEITQVGHGFAVGQPIYFNGAVWVLAQANSAATLATHLVYEVIDGDTFVAIQSGFFDVGLVGLVPGSYYFVSAMAPGVLTTVDPVSIDPNYFSNPVLQAITPTSGWVLPWRAFGLLGFTSGTFVSNFTTFDSTPSDAQVVPMPVDGVVLVRSEILAREQAPNLDRAVYIRTCRVNMNAGVPTVLTIQTDYTSEDDAAWDVTFSPLGGSVSVQVTGDAVNAVDWRVVTRTQAL